MGWEEGGNEVFIAKSSPLNLKMVVLLQSLLLFWFELANDAVNLYFL